MHPPLSQLDRNRLAVGRWLLVVCAFVALMVFVGGLTRLTHSGLSMVEWKPLMGALPPLSEEAWQEAFDKYKAFPEYQKLNRGMALSDFKRIFAFEYSHRLLGRTVGLVFFLPFAWFLLRRRVERRLILPLVGLLVFGGTQGLVGWWMVKSGLVDRPDVSQYRLATHLGLAFAIYVACLWQALRLIRPPHLGAARGDALRFGRGALALLAAVFVVAVSGAFVAGLDAGFGFNTFPLMDGRLVPVGLGLLEPAWRNLFENPAAVQFTHRVLALTTFGLLVWFWRRARHAKLPPRASTRMNWVLGAALLQVSLGIATLLSVIWLPLASAHQMGALLLLTALTVAAAEMTAPGPQTG